MNDTTWAALDAQLAVHPAADDKEARDVRFAREFLEAHPADAHLRAQVLGHLTGSAFVLDATRTQLLLLHHARLERWLQPGGHGEGETDPRLVALREVEEETGLTPADLTPFPDARIFDVDVHRIPASAKKNEAEHWHLDLRYGFVARAGAQPRISEESHALKWVALDALETLPGTDESVRRAARKLRAALRRQR